MISSSSSSYSEASVIQTLQSAFEIADVVISTGGVSMGDKV